MRLFYITISFSLIIFFGCHQVDKQNGGEEEFEFFHAVISSYLSSNCYGDVEQNILIVPLGGCSTCVDHVINKINSRPEIYENNFVVFTDIISERDTKIMVGNFIELAYLDKFNVISDSLISGGVGLNTPVYLDQGSSELYYLTIDSFDQLFSE